MVFPGVRLFRELQCGALREGGGTQEAGNIVCHGEPSSSISGGYARDSAKAEGSSIVDEPGEG